MSFLVSVIIPVFNGELFIEKAIASALEQPEVNEIIVVNDGSTDSTESIVEKLQTQNQEIKLFNHEHKINKGRSASRNLGIKKASGNFIAFLDADDFYLDNRFENDKIIFCNNNSIDGVYNAIGAHFYRESEEFERTKLKLTTITDKVKPADLFEVLLFYKKGHFSIDGLTVRKSIFDKIGYFNEKLIVAEDTELFYRMALKSKLQTGIIDKPVAMRGVHDSNVFNQESLYGASKLKVYEFLVFWSNKNHIQLDKIDYILNVLWMLKYKQSKGLLKDIAYWFLLFFKNPRLLFTKLGIKYFPVVRLRKKLFSFLYK